MNPRTRRSVCMSLGRYRQLQAHCAGRGLSLFAAVDAALEREFGPLPSIDEAYVERLELRIQEDSRASAEQAAGDQLRERDDGGLPMQVRRRGPRSEAGEPVGAAGGRPAPAPTGVREAAMARPSVREAGDGAGPPHGDDLRPLRSSARPAVPAGGGGVEPARRPRRQRPWYPTGQASRSAAPPPPPVFSAGSGGAQEMQPRKAAAAMGASRPSRDPWEIG